MFLHDQINENFNRNLLSICLLSFDKFENPDCNIVESQRTLKVLKDLGMGISKGLFNVLGSRTRIILSAAVLKQFIQKPGPAASRL